MQKQLWTAIALGAAALLGGCEAYVHTDGPPAKVEVQTSPPPRVDVDVKPGAAPSVDVDVNRGSRGVDVDVDVKKNP
jgi:hypothetical protein